MTLIEKIKSLFNEVKESFADVKTAEGEILRIEGDVKEGAKASVIAEDGTVSDAPAKDYTLEDGSVITIIEGGVIEKIIAPVDAAEDEKKEDAPAEEKEEEVKEEVKAADEVPAPADEIAALNAKVAELESALTMVAEQIKTLMDGGIAPAEMAEIKKENKSLKKQVKELAAEPATPAASFKKTVEVPNNQNSNKEKVAMSRIAKLRDELGIFNEANK